MVDEDEEEEFWLVGSVIILLFHSYAASALACCREIFSFFPFSVFFISVGAECVLLMVLGCVVYVCVNLVLWFKAFWMS